MYRRPPCAVRRLFVLLFLVLPLFSRADFTPEAPQAILYRHRVPTPEEVAKNDTHALFEPPYGCYLGAFIDFDGTLPLTMLGSDGKRRRNIATFEQIVGKPHASYFFYLGYGKPLPRERVRDMGKMGKFVHIALEPNDGMEKIRDDAYLRRLADDMAASGARIFLRLASEMNGTWTRYSRNPDLYRIKFRLVYEVMHRRAPNVALVWCPFAAPQSNIPDYYPGDKWVDWVGVNMYSVTFHNNDGKVPAVDEHPADMLRFVYNRYAARRPMMICEFAATHQDSVENRPRPGFAMRKILTLYAALPRRYPRVKSIFYFNSNNMQFVPGRAYNDYSVTNEGSVLDTYRLSIASPYYLSSPLPTPAPEPPVSPMPIRQGEVLRGMVKLSCYARATTDVVTVRFLVDGYPIHEANSPDQWECLWYAGSVISGKHLLSLEVRDGSGRLVAKTAVTIVTVG